MKQVEGTTQAAARAWLESTHDLCYADLYDIALPDGTVWHFTSADMPLVWAGQTYRSSGLVIKRGGLSTSMGLQVQTLQLTVTPDRDDTTMADLVAALDYTTLRGARVTWRGWYGDSWQAAVFACVEFAGRVTSIEDDVATSITCSSDLILLDTRMPRNMYQSDCGLEVYDSQCGVNQASYTDTATVLAGSTRLQLLLSGPVRAAGYYDGGGVRITSGAMTGITGSIRTHTVGVGPVLALVAPIEAVPAAGTPVQLWPGCDKTQTTCTTKFANLARFRGHPYIPMPETAV